MWQIDYHMGIWENVEYRRGSRPTMSPKASKRRKFNEPQAKPRGFLES